MVVASGALEVSGDCHRDKPGSDYENETRAAGMSYIHIVLCPPGPRVAMDTEKGDAVYCCPCCCFPEGIRGDLYRVRLSSETRKATLSLIFQRFFVVRLHYASLKGDLTPADYISKSIKNE